MSKNKIMFILQHPAHVHQFKYIIKILKNQKYNLKVVSIKKECSEELLKSYSIDFESISENKKKISKKLFDIILQIKTFYKMLHKSKIDLIVSRGNIAASIVSKLFNIKHIIYSDTDIRNLSNLSNYLVDQIVSPMIFNRNYGQNHHKINSFKELGYLSPQYFSPDPIILKKFRLKSHEPFFLLRFVAWDAIHDVGKAGLDKDKKIKLVKYLEKHGKVFISSEGNLPIELKKYKLNISPSKIHDFLSYSSMFISDSGTMCTEAACLGVPTFWISPYASEMGVFNELSNNYGLISQYKTFNGAFKKIKLVLIKNNSNQEKKLKKLFDDKIDINEYFINLIKLMLGDVSEKNTST